MSQMEVFMDYSCPFCLRGYGYLKKIYKQEMPVELVWNPCEAHPRPERHGRHSDLCIQGMFFAADQGVDLWTYHDRMYDAFFKDKIDVENIDALADYVKDLVDPIAYKEAIVSGKYKDKLAYDNTHAYEESGVWAVPSFRMDDHKLDAVEGVGITEKELEEFLAKAK